jgi:DNA-binding transcriptional LysR family regulator
MGIMKTLDLDAVQAFVLIATFANFTRVAEATATTQAAVSLKLKRLEAFLGRRLVERTPRWVRLTTSGVQFLEQAKLLLAANQRALSVTTAPAGRLRIGISDHVMPGALAALLARLGEASPGVVLEVGIDLSQRLMDGWRNDQFDVVIVRQERIDRAAEVLDVDGYAWFAAKSFAWRKGDRLPLANLAPPCEVRAIAVDALESAGIPWREAFVGGGVAALAAAARSGLAVVALARHRAPEGCVEVGVRFRLPHLPQTKVVLYSRVSGTRSNAALRLLSAAFRGVSLPQALAAVP